MSGRITWIDPVRDVIKPARFGSDHPMFMFVASYDRVLAPEGWFVWISTMGDETPIYFPPGEVMDLLPGQWTATGSYAGTGFWLVARRS